ncbi:MAG: LPS assembly lipoprotein LptE [Gammaproteobacteria bacterium]
MPQRQGARLAAGLLLLLLAGCGYHLRGSQGKMTVLPPIHVGGDQSTPLYGALRQSLRDTGTPLVAREQAQLLLNLLGENRERRVLSVSGAAKVQEYELIYSVTFELMDRAGKPLLARQTIRKVRDIRFDETAVNSLVSESEQLYSDMRTALVREIMRRLQAAARNFQETAP